MSKQRTVQPETEHSIKLQGVVDDESRRFLAVVYACSCHQKDGWWLCQYHQGFDDGVEEARDT